MKHLHHRGRIGQIPIYLGKFFRMFLYMDDWKVLPMAALIAAVVAFTVGKNMFLSMEGTLKGGLAMICVCIWNGCFNSIQVVCRERDIVKREHRSGMHTSSYILSHMVYQGFLCLMQTVVILGICNLTTIQFPKSGFITPWFLLDIGITFFLVTFAADMMSLLISCVVRTTTAAMTIMPFMLIFQLVFSNGTLFGLNGVGLELTRFSIARWGIDCVCAQGNYNTLPMVTVWNQLQKMQNLEVPELKEYKTEIDQTVKLVGLENAEEISALEEGKPVEFLVKYMEDNNLKDAFCYKIGEANHIEAYDMTEDNIKNCWAILIAFSLVFAFASVVVLRRIDKDKR